MAFSITPRLIIAAAEKRGWKVTIVSEADCVYRLDLPDGRHFYLRGITSVKSRAVNAIIANSKDLFHKIVPGIGVRLPATCDYAGDMEAAGTFLRAHKRLVVKPVNQAHGTGITTDVTTKARLRDAIAFAQMYSPKVILQQQIAGDDYRVLMIDHRVAAAAVRKPAFVVGDGVHTVRELIDQENLSDKRSVGYQTMLNSIDMASAARYLAGAMQQVPSRGTKVQVVGTANIGKGGVSLDVTDRLSPAIAAAAHRITQHLKLGLAGVDFMVAADGTPYVLEVNVTPSLGLHELPYAGKPRHTPAAFLDWLAKVE